MINTIGLMDKCMPVALLLLVVGLLIYMRALYCACVKADKKEDEIEYLDEDSDSKSQKGIDRTVIQKRTYGLIQDLFDVRSYGDDRSIVCYNSAVSEDMFHITTVLFPSGIFYVKIEYGKNTPIKNEIDHACYIQLHHDTEQAELFRTESDYYIHNSTKSSADIQLCNALFEIAAIGITEDFGY